MNKITLFIIALISSNCFSQKVQKDFQLSKILDETSGLEIVDDLFITQNDSGKAISLMTNGMLVLGSKKTVILLLNLHSTYIPNI